MEIRMFNKNYNIYIYVYNILLSRPFILILIWLYLLSYITIIELVELQISDSTDGHILLLNVLNTKRSVNEEPHCILALNVIKKSKIFIFYKGLHALMTSQNSTAKFGVQPYYVKFISKGKNKDTFKRF